MFEYFSKIFQLINYKYIKQSRKINCIKPLDRPYMQTKQKVYRVPVRTHEIRLNCSVSANPMPHVQWYFLPHDVLKAKLLENNRAVSVAKLASQNTSATTSSSSAHHHRHGFADIELGEAWKSINLVASYSYKHDDDTTSSTNSHEDDFNEHSIATADTSANNSSYSIVKLPLSKYQIFERRNINHVSSTLEIKVQI